MAQLLCFRSKINIFDCFKVKNAIWNWFWVFLGLSDEVLKSLVFVLLKIDAQWSWNLFDRGVIRMPIAFDGRRLARFPTTATNIRDLFSSVRWSSSSSNFDSFTQNFVLKHDRIEERNGLLLIVKSTIVLVHLSLIMFSSIILAHKFDIILRFRPLMVTNIPWDQAINSNLLCLGKFNRRISFPLDHRPWFTLLIWLLIFINIFNSYAFWFRLISITLPLITVHYFYFGLFESFQFSFFFLLLDLFLGLNTILFNFVYKFLKLIWLLSF